MHSNQFLFFRFLHSFLLISGLIYLFKKYIYPVLLDLYHKDKDEKIALEQELTLLGKEIQEKEKSISLQKDEISRLLKNQGIWQNSIKQQQERLKEFEEQRYLELEKIAKQKSKTIGLQKRVKNLALCLTESLIIKNIFEDKKELNNYMANTFKELEDYK